MDEQTLKHFESLFLEMKKNKGLVELAKETDKYVWKEGDEIDLAMQQRDEELGRKLEGRQSFYLRKVDAALERVRNETFGCCSDCDGDISLTRLYARPTANLCIQCKEDQERDEKSVRYDKKSHTLGRELNNQNVIPIGLKSEDKTSQKVLAFNKTRIDHF